MSGLKQGLPFYHDVNDLAARLSKQIFAGEMPWQPEPAMLRNDFGEVQRSVQAIYITAIHNRAGRTTGVSVDVDGRECVPVAGAPLKLGCTRIVEGTHRLSSEDEVKGWKARQAEQLAYHQQRDLKGRNKFEVTIPQATV